MSLTVSRTKQERHFTQTHKLKIERNKTFQRCFFFHSCVWFRYKCPLQDIPNNTNNFSRHNKACNSGFGLVGYDSKYGGEWSVSQKSLHHKCPHKDEGWTSIQLADKAVALIAPESWLLPLTVHCVKEFSPGETFKTSFSSAGPQVRDNRYSWFAGSSQEHLIRDYVF